MPAGPSALARGSAESLLGWSVLQMTGEKTLHLDVRVLRRGRLVGHRRAEARRRVVVFHSGEHLEPLSLDVEVMVGAGVDDERHVCATGPHGSGHLLALH